VALTHRAGGSRSEAVQEIPNWLGIGAVRSSRQPLCGVLRMRNSVNAIQDCPHGEERRRRVSNHARRSCNHPPQYCNDAATVLMRSVMAKSKPAGLKAWLGALYSDISNMRY
jgi:hypothetical protein